MVTLLLNIVFASSLYLMTRDMLVSLRVQLRNDPLHLTQPLGDLRLLLGLQFAGICIYELFVGQYLLAFVSGWCAVSDLTSWWKNNGKRRWKAVTARVKDLGHRLVIEPVPA